MNTLFDVDDIPHTATPQERFQVFHERNPHVFRELERMTNELILRGRKRISTKMLFEVLRYDYYMTTDDQSSDFKLNNSYTAFYSRSLIERHPDWLGLFELRSANCDI